MDADEASGAEASSCHLAMNADEARGAEASCGPTHVVELAASAAGALALMHCSGRCAAGGAQAWSLWQRK